MLLRYTPILPANWLAMSMFMRPFAAEYLLSVDVCCPDEGSKEDLRKSKGEDIDHGFQSPNTYELVPPRHASWHRRGSVRGLRFGSALRPRCRYSVRIRRVEISDGSSGTQSEAVRRAALRHPQSPAALRRASIGYHRQHWHPGMHVRQ